jgi:LPXTG-motif cell wall-anchored protein
MALISCPECGRSVSDQADSCPQCGRPVGKSKNVYITNAKKGKGKKLIGGLLLILSTIMSAANTGASTSSGLSAFIGLMFIAGIILLIYGKIEHWWHWR